jgi:hypothetical protein
MIQMKLMKNGLLGGAALALMTLGLVTPQGQANESEEHMKMEMCVRKAAMDFQDKVQHCDSSGETKEHRQKCMEKAREKFAEEREKCQMMRGNEGGGKGGHK